MSAFKESVVFLGNTDKVLFFFFLILLFIFLDKDTLFVLLDFQMQIQLILVACRVSKDETC